MSPRIPITDKRFEYTPSHLCDIRTRFTAERERLAKQREQQSTDTAKIIAIYNQRREQEK